MSEMVVGNKLKAEDLNLCFEKLMMVGSGSDGKAKTDCGVITEWKDIPMELLLRIMSLVDDRMIIVASGVCSGWRDAIGLGLTHLSLVWYVISAVSLHLMLGTIYVLLLI